MEVIKMNDQKEKLICDECNGMMIKDFIRNETYCSKCGLVYDPNHPMHRGLSGLIDYMNHRSLNDYVDDARVTYVIEGLAAARLKVSKL